MIFDNSPKKQQLVQEMAELFNRIGLDTECNIPDHILASYVFTALENLRSTVVANDAHFGIAKSGGQILRCNQPRTESDL